LYWRGKQCCKKFPQSGLTKTSRNHMGTTNHLRGFPRILSWALILLLAVIGLAIGIGGIKLITLGGSFYFLIMGIAMVISAVLIFLKKRSGIVLYAVSFIASIIWAITDAGFEFWPLFARLFTFGVLALIAALVWPYLAGSSEATQSSKKPAFTLAGILAVVLAGSFGLTFKQHNAQYASNDFAPVKAVDAGAEQKDWKHWANTTHGDRFAALDQINKSNVGDLEVAWTAHTGDIPASTGAGAEDQNTPLQVGDTLYMCTAYSKVIALDVDTGKEKWRYDPKASSPNWQRCRGLGYFEEAQASNAPATTDLAGGTQPAQCVRRLFLPTIDARLIALNADTGEPCADFANNGTLDLKARMGEVKDGYYQQTSAPLVAGNLVVVGGRVADNFDTNEPAGVVRAFNVHTGKLVWAWDPTITDGVAHAADTKDFTRATPNVWTAMSYDEKLNLVYLPTGNTTPDFWGGQRTPEDEKYSSSIVAVDANTGKVRWHFQTTHHDLWDFDLPSQPLLYDLPDDKGGVTPVLVQTSKQGMIFMLNRETGVPVAEVKELPVPAGNAAGERYSPTQPYSVGMPMLGNQTLKESDMWGMTPLDLLSCRIEFKQMRHDGVYTPPGLDYSLQFPGSLGGMNWGSVSIDPNNSVMFVNDMRLGLANYLVPREGVSKNASGIEMGIVPMTGTPFGAMRKRFVSALGVPCQKPPFGTMTAIDLKTRQIAWQVPVGTVEDTGPMGLRMKMKMPIGMPTLGATMTTQSGLLFFAGTQDFYLRAYDTATGKVIWKSRLPVGSQGGPMTYVSPKTGKQYVVITAGGARQSPDRGDYIIAYALPEKK
jgi:quinate dehydrogenase (quinone)